MIKKLFILFSVVFTQNVSSQVLYSESFSGLALNSGTYSANSATQTYLYGDLAVNMLSINNNNAIADTLTANYPFRANLQKQKAWLAYKPASHVNVNDTFAVSTSWVNPTGSSDSWMITPSISNITANTVLSWEALAPDATNSDGYSVYISTSSNLNPNVSDFSFLLTTVSAENNIWTKRGLSLATFAGQNIRIAFRNNSTNKYQLWIDDIKVENLTNTYDVASLSNKTYKYSVPFVNNIISASFKNNGAVAINNVVLNYKVGNNSTVTEYQSLSSPINYLDNKTFTFSTPFTTGTSGYYPIKLWVSLVNGQADQNTINDTIYGGITISSLESAKKVLVEEYTSAQCGWCPDGYTKLSSIAVSNTNIIVAAIHSNDNMSSTEGNALTADYSSQLPSATIDQYSFSNTKVALDKNSWNSYISQRQAMRVPATVTLTNVNYNATTQEINATVAATFYGDVKGDYRLNLYVKENNVYGPGSDNSDNQWNQYSNLYAIPSSPYYQLGTYLNPTTYLLNSSEYMHQYVINTIAGGAYGVSGIIPSNGNTAGQTYTATFSYTLPIPTGGEFRYNADNIYLIGLLTEYNTDVTKREVVNACEAKLTLNPESAVGIKETSNIATELNLYPNPSSDVVYLNYNLNTQQTVSIQVYNTLGELVYIENANELAGKVIHPLNLKNIPQGNYSIVLSINNQSITKKLIVIK